MITIITPTLNSEKTINRNIKSINEQREIDIEHIIVDGYSKDETIKKILNRKLKKTKIIYQKPNGIYDAMNCGIKNAKGNIVGILNSDDYYSSKFVLKKINKIFSKNKNIDICYGNLRYFNNDNIFFRFWRPGKFENNCFYKGWNPPHPTFFVRRKIYMKHGLFKTRYGNASDIELMYRLLSIKKINSYYLNSFMVNMRSGGASGKNIFVIFKQNMQIIKIFKDYKKQFSIIIFIFSKIKNRFLQFLN
jgi:glycosyltransferase involved in cell wall biosynthesis